MNIIEDEMAECREALDILDEELHDVIHELGLLDGRWTKVVCLHCNGRGYVTDGHTRQCYKCQGMGYHTAIKWTEAKGYSLKHDTRPINADPERTIKVAEAE